jgi:O-glycosyl hydrolase
MNYFVKFVGAYEQNGIPINDLSVQNEPLFQTSGYPTMFMTPLDEGHFISQYRRRPFGSSAFGAARRASSRCVAW